MSDFIKFDCFLIKKSEIAWVKREDMSILIMVKSDGKYEAFRVSYSCEYAIERCLDNLSGDLDAVEIEYYKLKSCVIDQNQRIRRGFHETTRSIDSLTKELKIIKKHLKLADGGK